ncbi:HD domain-containing protein [Demequina pelophila]|uniref:HD domain-containing protein n=1 Tax=Demequina pelophila TaxID=1638984 RepID=UPI000780203B|nr:HD domain-containing protein [Demequina pelophila]
MHVVEIAAAAHAGQTDKAGRAYIGHPMRVAEHVRRLYPECERGVVDAAWLHDVIEDTGWDADRLLAHGVDPRTVEAVVALTRVAGEESHAYYARVAANPWAVMVKHADITDNTDPSRVALLAAAEPERAATLSEKYATARTTLGLTDAWER